MLATLSVESKIRRQLQELGCAPTNFAGIGGILGKSRVMQALTGRKPFERSDAARLLEILEEMCSLQREFDCPIDWAQVGAIQNALLTRRVRRIARELEGEKESDGSQRSSQRIEV